MIHFHYQDNGDNHDYPHMNDFNRLSSFSGRQSYIGFILRCLSLSLWLKAYCIPHKTKSDEWKYDRFRTEKKDRVLRYPLFLHLLFVQNIPYDS